MKLAERPAAGELESELPLRTELSGKDADEFIQFLERSKTYNPAKTAYLEAAVAYSHQLLKTGRLPD